MSFNEKSLGGALMGVLIGYVSWTQRKMKKNLMITAIIGLFISGIAIVFIMETNRMKADRICVEMKS